MLIHLRRGWREMGEKACEGDGMVRHADQGWKGDVSGGCGIFHCPNPLLSLDPQTQVDTVFAQDIELA